MSDSAPERLNANSKSNLIEVQHVGVTAKLHSPLKTLLPTSSSSSDMDARQLLHHSKTSKYDKFSNVDSHVDTESSTDASKILYEMRAIRGNCAKVRASEKITPSKIEFQLYNKTTRRRSTHAAKVSSCKRKPAKRKLFEGEPKSYQQESIPDLSLLQRLRNSLQIMRSPTHYHRPSQKMNKKNSIDHIIFDDLPEPNLQREQQQQNHATRKAADTRIGIYPFEHGCAEYLRTTDCHPNILSIVLAERATRYATRFWAEFFGTLHIGVAFVITFLLQSYRFLLYALVNTLLVGFLCMTSDYLIKPILTVAFNGFLQPPLIFVYNIFTSIRDILEPIADTINNFLKPVGNIFRNVRLVHATYNNRKIASEV